MIPEKRSFPGRIMVKRLSSRTPKRQFVSTIPIVLIGTGMIQFWCNRRRRQLRSGPFRSGPLRANPLFKSKPDVLAMDSVPLADASGCDSCFAWRQAIKATSRVASGCENGFASDWLVKPTCTHGCGGGAAGSFNIRSLSFFTSGLEGSRRFA